MLYSSILETVKYVKSTKGCHFGWDVVTNPWTCYVSTCV